METEVRSLQQKVNRLEESLILLESQSTMKINTILAELILNRAEQAEAQRKIYQNEKDFYQKLLAKCNWMHYEKEKTQTNNSESEEANRNTITTNILLQTLEQGNRDSQLEIRIDSTKSNCSNMSDNLECHRSSQKNSTEIQSNESRPDSLSAVASNFRLGDTVIEFAYNSDAEHLDDDKNECIQNIDQLQLETNILQMNSTDNSREFQSRNVDFQPRCYDGDSELEIQTSRIDSHIYNPEENKESWRLSTGMMYGNEDNTEQTDIYDEIPEFQSHSQSVLNKLGTTVYMQNYTNQLGHSHSTSKSKKQNKCKLCPAAFTLRRTLIMHMASFHKTPQRQRQSVQLQPKPKDQLSLGDKPQKRLFCKYPHCQKSYASTQNLKIHMRSHTGERPHVCIICQKAFADPSCLRRHTMYYHGVRLLNGGGGVVGLGTDY